MTPIIRIGDVRARLAELPADSVHCCVTSPPYWGLRDYGVAGQLGLEPTPEAHVAAMVDVFRAVRRVLRPDGVCWVNYGDCYASDPSWGRDNGTTGLEGAHQSDQSRGGAGGRTKKRGLPGLKPKDLVGMPWRVAFALQADGWWLRADCIWAKPNPMPESVTDRPTKAHEYVFLLTKSARYFYDAEAVREEKAESTQNDPRSNGNGHRRDRDYPGAPSNGGTNLGGPEGGRNLRSVWSIPTHAFPEAHFATFPPKLAETCIRAGTSERGCCPACGAPWARVVEKRFQPQTDVSAEKGIRGAGEQKPLDASNGRDGFPRGSTLTNTVDWRPTCGCAEKFPQDDLAPIPCTVLDPFAGSGTTLLVADRLGRRAVGIELNPEYAAMAQRRLAEEVPLLSGGSGEPTPLLAESQTGAAARPTDEGQQELLEVDT